jgi:hypothetical protein
VEKPNTGGFLKYKVVIINFKEATRGYIAWSLVLEIRKLSPKYCFKFMMHIA